MGRVSFGRPAVVRSLLKRYFTALEQERNWVTDITVIATLEGQLFIYVVLDWYSKPVIGWYMHHRQDQQMEIWAVKMTARGPGQ